LHQGALQTTFSVFLDIFYPKFCLSWGKWTFLTPTGHYAQNPSLSVIAMLRQLNPREGSKKELGQAPVGGPHARESSESRITSDFQN